MRASQLRTRHLNRAGDLVVVASQVGGVEANRVAARAGESGNREPVDAIAEVGAGEQRGPAAACERDANARDLRNAKADDGGTAHAQALCEQPQRRRGLQVGLEMRGGRAVDLLVSARAQLL